MFMLFAYIGRWHRVPIFVTLLAICYMVYSGHVGLTGRTVYGHYAGELPYWTHFFSGADYSAQSSGSTVMAGDGVTPLSIAMAVALRNCLCRSIDAAAVDNLPASHSAYRKFEHGIYGFWRCVFAGFDLVCWWTRLMGIHAHYVWRYLYSSGVVGLPAVCHHGNGLPDTREYDQELQRTIWPKQPSRPHDPSLQRILPFALGCFNSYRIWVSIVYIWNRIDRRACFGRLKNVVHRNTDDLPVDLETALPSDAALASPN